MWALQNNKATDTIPYMNSLTTCVNKVVKDGFKDSFKVMPRGLYSCANSRYFRPEQVSIVDFYRFEGQSDPSDNAIMYVIETADGSKGTLIDAYGAYADASINVFMNEVEDIHKKVIKQDKHEC